ncbi:ATP-binding protein [Streptomyces sp. NBC_00569]|uniref:P-loop NTPase fold protein n=1 Tax=unclassified Streptomyces TaxID=2593676 RepID=UPI002E803055|nr:P-loop NTPase fold protein [Streptomyces sp. NBC_00569]WUB92723.1 ATP-binding protein [Streptomyces sp. NBC_00569]
MYARTVAASLDSPRVRRHFDARPGVTADAVRAEMSSPSTVGRALGQVRGSLVGYRRAVDGLARTRTERARARSTVGIDVRSVLVYPSVSAAVFIFIYTQSSGLSLWAELAAFVGAGALACAPTFLAISDSRSRQNLKNQLLLVGYTLSLPFDRFDVRRAAKSWERDLRDYGTPRAAIQVIEQLMGADPHSVLLPGDFAGLRSATDARWVVTGEASRQLERKLAALEDGTIAVCGPRGVGKTTVLQAAARSADVFSVTVRVPAAYTPYDLVLATFTKLCERFMAREDVEVPQLTRLSGFVRTRQHVRRVFRGIRRSLFFGIPAIALITLGTAKTVRTLWDRHREGVQSWAGTTGRWITEHTEDIWQGRSVGAGLAVTAAGLVFWRLGKSDRWRRRLLRWPGVTLRLAAACLILGPIVSLPFDADVRRHFLDALDLHAKGLGVTFLLLVMIFISLGAYILGETTHRHVLAPLWKVASALLLALALWIFLRIAVIRGILLDPDNSARVAYAVAGMLLLKVGSLRVRSEEPELVTKCRDHLIQLRTTQSTSAALNVGASGPATIGSTHTSSLASIPPNFPQLVEDLRARLADVAKHVKKQGGRTIICIDELDRLGSDKQALAFLSEIKAILGVPSVHYLISVAEDVGAAFIRRGLPHRDATDSSLDDILHVQPGDLTQSLNIMDERARDFPKPYVFLAHALSGGLPRDLIRYGRRMLEMHSEIASGQQASAVELTEISRRLIVEELSDTLGGFRTLLAKQQWTHQNATWLSGYRVVMDQLRTACPHSTTELVASLEYVAASGVAPATGPVASLPEAAQQLITEASAYTYYVLTLFQIFHPEDFEDRRTRASTTPAGRPQFLAEARLELAVSPHTARPMIDSARAAWHLRPLTSTLLPAVIPAPRPQPCTSASCRRLV